MAGANVQVTYNPNAVSPEPVWKFRPDSAKVTASGNIVFTAAPNSAWKFTGCNIKNGGSIFGTPSINPNGNEMTVSDSCPAKATFEYTITVLPNGQNQNPVTSPDPEIVNDPGS